MATYYKDGGFHYEMKYSLANTKKEIHKTHLQLMQLLQFAITSLTSLFAALTTADGTSYDTGPSGHGKTTCNCGDDEDALKYLTKFS